MSVPLIPWEPHVFPEAIQAELRRRATNRGMKPTPFTSTTWNKNEDDWNQYQGPMTAWVRVCSNGYGLESKFPPMPGFVFYGGKDFYQSYGFQEGLFAGAKPGIPNTSILGYCPDGAPHVIENDIFNSHHPIHVPTPEIEKISATINKELLRRVRIEWTCFSSAQLEYMSPYFLIPGISVIVEWGWNHFNPLSLVNLTDMGKLAELYNNPYPLYTENVLNSKGNYEIVFGIVTNFEWSIDGNKIKCVTEVTSKDRLWAGQIVNSNMIEQDMSLTGDSKNKEGVPNTIHVVDSLKRFVTENIDQFKNLVNTKKDIDTLIKESQPVVLTKENSHIPNPINSLYFFLKYLKANQPANCNEYLRGLFYGRDETTVAGPVMPTYGFNVGVAPTGTKTKVINDEHANKDHDFDCQSPRSNFWINMGLIVEIINFFSSQLKGVKNQPLFRVDVDDCVISAHPNLISTNGDVLLIPNALAPKYFAGMEGDVAWGKDKKTEEYREKMVASSDPKPVLSADQLEADKTEGSLDWANYRMYQIVLPLLGKVVPRDNLNLLINAGRVKPGEKEKRHEFPFVDDYVQTEGKTQRRWDKYYTGFFKSLYLNSKAFSDICNDPAVTKFSDVYESIFRAINSAAAGFWDLRLVGSTGRENTKGLATMKIVDDKMSQYTSNVGDVFTFDYYAADGLLQSINFRPMLSNAQAIRTIYAQTNLTNKKKVVMSGYNELLDYKFKDRLFMLNDQSENIKDPEALKENSFRASMAKLQALRPPDKSFQMTSKTGSGQKIIYRLAIPPNHADVLSLLLDDNDKTHNPRYTGIMPGIQAEFTIQGLAGLRTFGMFRVRGLPEPYSEENIVFRIINVTDTIQNGQWVTNIVAGVIPLRGYFRSKLGLSPKAAEKGQ